MHDFGTIQWELVLSLFVAWLIIFLSVIKGIHSAGKVGAQTAFILQNLMLHIMACEVCTKDILKANRGDQQGFTRNLTFLIPDSKATWNSTTWDSATKFNGQGHHWD